MARFLLPLATPGALPDYLLTVRPGDTRVAAGGPVVIEADVFPRTKSVPSCGITSPMLHEEQRRPGKGFARLSSATRRGRRVCRRAPERVKG